ncbi:sugar ABC transporter substrate-binding protein [Butyrivibrio sp. YAB3001]|uniref:sugar ABC transporter substrate-binding protein n=1 Tax=Butyrivibrio sp. YAB3001 TaxID=1520812 RepID=UPI0008F63F2E|nr:extracellular solute-binding protein [Butyrivibrio sp. YAB3001]SFB72186.1 Maltose-binding protein MalE [Butyrivibrio sp. YAB3001]
MRIKVRIFSILLVAAALAGTFVYARSGQSIFESYSIFPTGKTTIRLWYTDEALTPYLQARSVAYSETNQNVRIEPVLVSGLEYLEAINEASLANENYPDIFIITNDSLEKAYLAGLAMEITDGEDYLSSEMFPDAAIRSVTYNGRYIAYPFYFETSSLIYNKTYLEDMAAENLENAMFLAEAENAQEGSETTENAEAEGGTEEAAELSITQDMIDSEVEKNLPKTISDILEFAQSYNAPEQVEAVFKWDVTDIFYNYSFVGNYMNVGGRAGDDVSMIDIYNTDTISCMKIYQQLNQFFAIDADEIDYESVSQDFIDGKIVFTVATTDIIGKIKAAQNSGECPYEFGVADMPDLNSKYSTRTMSVTDCIVVNGYTENIAKANAVARYICNDNSADLYNNSGKLAAHYGIKYNDNNLSTFVDVYDDSIPMPKTIETSNLWMELEIAFTKIWNGEDCNSILKQVSEKIKTQITGEQFVEETLPDPENLDITEGLSEESD